MATVADIKRKIDTLLTVSASGMKLQLNSNTLDRAYEAYIFSLCKVAVERAGVTVNLRGIKSRGTPKTLVFRGAPGYMDSLAQDFCYAYCELNGKEFEIHLDVQYEGCSSALHEIDVSVYEHESAEKIRNTGKIPKSDKLIMMFECKFYDKSIVSTNVARAFAGLVQDCRGNKVNAFASNNGSDNLKKYFSNKYNIEPFIDLDSTNVNAEGRFIRVIEQALRKWAI